MISCQFNYFDRFRLQVCAPTQEPILAFVRAELGHHIMDGENALPSVGTIHVVAELELPSNCTVLRHQHVFYESGRLYYKYCGGLLAIQAGEHSFDVIARTGTDPFLVFYVSEALLRWYAVMYGIVFLHATGFRWHGKTVIVNAFGGTGKTNLLLDMLLDRGEYLADDLVAVDAERNAYAYLKRINLLPYNLEYRRDMLDHLGIPQKLLRRLGRFDQLQHSRFLPLRLVGRRLHIAQYNSLITKVDYTTLTPNGTHLSGPYPIDHFIWLERHAAEERTFPVSADYYAAHMRLCLDLENSYFEHLLYFAKALLPRLAILAGEETTIIYAIGAKGPVTGICRNEMAHNETSRRLRELIDTPQDEVESH